VQRQFPRAGRGPPAFTLVLRDPKQLRSLVTTRAPVLLAVPHFRCEIDVNGDLYGALELKSRFEGLAPPWCGKLAMLPDSWRQPSRAEPAKTGTLLTRLAQRFCRQHTFHSPHRSVKLSTVPMTKQSELIQATNERFGEAITVSVPIHDERCRIVRLLTRTLGYPMLRRLVAESASWRDQNERPVS